MDTYSWWNCIPCFALFWIFISFPTGFPPFSILLSADLTNLEVPVSMAKVMFATLR